MEPSEKTQDTHRVTYVSELVVPEMGLVALEQLDGEVAVLPVALLTDANTLKVKTHIV